VIESKHEYDIVVIGGGPAGISTAIWASDLNLTCALVERSRSLGGQLSHVYNPIHNYPGRDAESGEEMRKHFLESLKNADIDLFAGREVFDVDTSDRSVNLEDGTSIHGRAIIIATGVRRRKLNVPGEDDFEEKGILSSGAKDPEGVACKNVVIVGGGDAAIENALILSKHAKHVTIIHRRESFKARAKFLESAMSTSNIEFLTNKEIVSFSGEDRLATVEVRDRNSDKIDSLKMEAALIRIGSQPNSELFRGLVETDVNDYILVSSTCETSAPNIYAIGDIANPFSQNLSTASGNASTAVSHISKRRIASD
jgi:thioredoxin reductase (NADPH)